jgi:hypothetical protein
MRFNACATDRDEVEVIAVALPFKAERAQQERETANEH